MNCWKLSLFSLSLIDTAFQLTAILADKMYRKQQRVKISVLELATHRAS